VDRTEVVGDDGPRWMVATRSLATGDRIRLIDRLACLYPL
jgi:hypothetical protein